MGTLRWLTATQWHRQRPAECPASMHHHPGAGTLISHGRAPALSPQTLGNPTPKQASGEGMLSSGLPLMEPQPLLPPLPQLLPCRAEWADDSFNGVALALARMPELLWWKPYPALAPCDEWPHNSPLHTRSREETSLFLYLSMSLSLTHNPLLFYGIHSFFTVVIINTSLKTKGPKIPASHFQVLQEGGALSFYGHHKPPICINPLLLPSPHIHTHTHNLLNHWAPSIRENSPLKDMGRHTGHNAWRTGWIGSV